MKYYVVKSNLQKIYTQAMNTIKKAEKPVDERQILNTHS